MRLVIGGFMVGAGGTGMRPPIHRRHRHELTGIRLGLESLRYKALAYES